jgi:hypothetical protein
MKEEKGPEKEKIKYSSSLVKNVLCLLYKLPIFL